MASYTWADIDPDAHTATTYRLARLHNRYPLLLPPEATIGWDTRLPRDTRSITPELLARVLPTGVDLIMTSPPMLAKHLPGDHRGCGHHAHATISQINHLIRYLATTQEGGMGYIRDAPYGPKLSPQVHALMGPSTVLNAPKCGSGAHRPTHMWQNLLPKEELEEAYLQLSGLQRPINDILDHAGLSC